MHTKTEDFNYLMQALWKHVVLSENLTFVDFVAIDDKLQTEIRFSEDALILSFLDFTTGNSK